MTIRTEKIKYIAKSRYPGLVSFSERQADLFHGREDEIKELYDLLMAEQVIILYAKSGVGKSSLLNAGLIPKLKRYGFYPIKVRFQNPQSGLDAIAGNQNRSFWRRLGSYFRKQETETIAGDMVLPDASIIKSPRKILLASLTKPAGEIDYSYSVDTSKMLNVTEQEPRLWEQLKALTIKKEAPPEPAAGSASAESSIAKTFPAHVTPVLVFDQFEEFFWYAAAERKEFMEQLGEVFHNLPPKRLAEWLRGVPPADRTTAMINWVKQPTIKCIIAIRDDKLSELDQLRAYIPLILKNRYKLNPLLVKNAGKAMELPAQRKGDFDARPFDFDKAALQKILYKLSGDTPIATGQLSAAPVDAANFDNGIDGSQLQKVCMQIEKRVIEAQATTATVIVNSELINPETDVQLILDTFYEEQLKTLGSDSDISLSRTIIEGHLVAGGARASITATQLKSLLQESSVFFAKDKIEPFINRLIEARLIKEEYTHLGRTFELSHDTLVNSVSKFAEENKLKKTNKVRFVYGVLLFFSSNLLVLCGFLFYKMNASSNNINMNLGNTFYAQGNHFYAFNIWDNYLNRLFKGGAGEKHIDSAITNQAFFDIGSGDNMVVLSDSLMAVHEKNDVIDLWKINYRRPDTGRLKLKQFTGAYNLEISNSGNYFGYRTAAGELIIYNARMDTVYSIDSATTKIVKRGTAGDYDNTDYLMNFIPGGGDFVGFVDKTGEIGLYNLNQGKTGRGVPLTILKLQDTDFDSFYINHQLRISDDQQFLAIHKRSKINIWDIGKPVPVLVNQIRNVKDFYYNFKTSYLCYSTSDSLVWMPYDPKFAGHAKRFAVTHKMSTTVSPDKKGMLFYNKAKQLVILNGPTNSIDTVIKDWSYFQNRPVNPVNYFSAHWLYQSLVRYTTKDLDADLWGLKKDLHPVTTLLSDSSYVCSGVSWKLVDDTLKAEKNGKLIFMDTFLQPTTPDDDIAEALISTGGNKLAYIIKDQNSINSLKVVDMRTAKILLIVPNISWLGDLLNDKYVTAYDDRGHAGIFFLGTQKRDREYYRKLFPEFSSSYKEKLGINIF